MENIDQVITSLPCKKVIVFCWTKAMYSIQPNKIFLKKYLDSILMIVGTVKNCQEFCIDNKKE